jgi:hypothetical protein
MGLIFSREVGREVPNDASSSDIASAPPRSLHDSDYPHHQPDVEMIVVPPPSAEAAAGCTAGQGPGRRGVPPPNPTKLVPYSSRGRGVCGTRSNWVRSGPTNGASRDEPTCRQVPSGSVKCPALCAIATIGVRIRPIAPITTSAFFMFPLSVGATEPHRYVRFAGTG